jgi:Cu2+-containing amine oxidase
MNILVNELSRDHLNPSQSGKHIKIEDNIGESIHIHIGNYRLEMSVQEFLDFADRLEIEIDH